MNRTRSLSGEGYSLPGLNGENLHQELRLYRLKEAEELTGIKVRRLKRLIEQGKLVGTRLSQKDMRVSARDLLEYFNQCKTRTIL